MRLLLVLILIPSILRAETLVDPARVISVVTADWNGDGVPDRATLVESGNLPETAELFIALGNPVTGGYDNRTHARWAAWYGTKLGQQPALEQAGSRIRLHSGNQDDGREGWNMAVDISFRDEGFYVDGFSYERWDTSGIRPRTTCEIDMVTGEGSLKRAGLSSHAVVPLYRSVAAEEWDPERFKATCEF